jgi:excisionase family DNA binding protein
VAVKNKSRPKVDDPFFDVAGSASYLGQTERWVRRQVEEGNIRYAKMGNLLRFRRSWLDTYVEEHTVTPEGRS